MAAKAGALAAAAARINARSCSRKRMKSTKSPISAMRSPGSLDFLDQGPAVSGHVSSLYEAAPHILSAGSAVTYSDAGFATCRGLGAFLSI
jgi:hypothetical protein